MHKVGMYGGSFDPLHLGHVNDIIKASSMCQELHVILSYSLNRDSVHYKQRYQWLVEVTKELENVFLHAIEDGDDSKSTYNWELGAENIKDSIGQDIDVVFCGSDYQGTGRFEALYPESEIVYFDRDIVKISSTEIRENLIDFWDYIPKAVRPYYTKKVLLVGGESTGKSTLTRNLALAFNTVYLEEVGRTVCERAQNENMMMEEDFLEIMVKHKAKEYDKLKEANKVLFEDTDCLTTLFYSGFLCENNKVNEAYKKLATGINYFNKYDLVIFLEPDVEFIQDGTRNEKIKKNRQMYSDILEDTFTGYGLKYIKLGGSYLNRFETAYKLVRELIS